MGIIEERLTRIERRLIIGSVASGHSISSADFSDPRKAEFVTIASQIKRLHAASLELKEKLGLSYNAAYAALRDWATATAAPTPSSASFHGTPEPISATFSEKASENYGVSAADFSEITKPGVPSRAALARVHAATVAYMTANPEETSYVKAQVAVAGLVGAKPATSAPASFSAPGRPPSAAAMVDGPLTSSDFADMANPIALARMHKAALRYMTDNPDKKMTYVEALAEVKKLTEAGAHVPVLGHPVLTKA